MAQKVSYLFISLYFLKGFFFMRKFNIFFFALVFIGFSCSSLFANTHYNSCVTCHGLQGEGVAEKKGPKLAGQHSWYTLIQLEAFAKGERKHTNIGLSKTEKEALSLYIEQLK
ncbi:MAG: c-type cytochrome [Bacteriovoracaceae bacterium]|nr:c-type cytochrome [Bacteriovoracaceae bacterium]